MLKVENSNTLTNILAIGLLAVGVVAFSADVDAGSKQKSITFQNTTSSQATLNISFGSNSQITADDLTSFCTKGPTKLNCSKTLPANMANPVEMPNPDFKYVNMTTAFNAAVGCGSTKAEMNVNSPVGTDVTDISVVDGFNVKIAITVSATTLGPPAGQNGNQKIFGVYPYSCDGCAISINPSCGIPKDQSQCHAGTQYAPVPPCQYQIDDDTATLAIKLLP